MIIAAIVLAIVLIYIVVRRRHVKKLNTETTEIITDGNGNIIGSASGYSKEKNTEPHIPFNCSGQF
jgi:hypothetical protein